ncbi:formylglycine-generating enzyme family protein [Saccharospirillum impatiens]|uniref:formylglycine-generating enzyme family protein n=1 Tax=Saccharospirillum impatiens TaxID=169438 RepID=UPI00040C8909|nr:SUMF1/EgtB/PvdO family nonheme iron enzyme [Saccharospirillum impatiens]
MKARYWLGIAILIIGGITFYALNLNPSKHLPRLKVTDADIDALIDRTYEQMVFVEGGEFLMGDIMHDGLYSTMGNDNKPAVEVTLDSYSIGAYEVSYRDFDIYTAANNLPGTLDEDWAVGQEWREPQYPAGTSWTGAKNYCLWIAEITGEPFDLPTEAQWEYAARSRGVDVIYGTDDGTIRLGENYEDGANHPLPSGTFPPNSLGLYDMSGNMKEWVNDWYDENYYQTMPRHNPPGPDSGTEKVTRGGVFGESFPASNVVIRFTQPELNTEFRVVGFRCALNTRQPVSAP